MDDNWDDDPLFIDAARFIIENNICSAVGLQKHFRIGYGRASRIVENLELLGLVSGFEPGGNRHLIYDNFDKWWESVEALSKEDLPAPDMTNVVLWPGEKRK